MTDTITYQNIDLSSWDTLYMDILGHLKILNTVEWLHMS
jgi:hypothetical protein